ncbi:MAG: hydantoinase/oxoprolinase family protein, partial [Hyphomicrobiales bacterium]
GGEVFVEKTLTTPEDLLTGFFAGVSSVIAKARLRPDEVDGAIVHATTVVTNALIERKRAHVAMVFTQGFADILEIRDERRYDMYDPQIEFPKPLVRAPDIFTVRERVLSDGTVEVPLAQAEIDRLCGRLAGRGIESVGICFLNAYRNGINERRLADGIGKALPGVHVSVSCEIAPQIREYLRASTVSANAYAIPITKPYLDGLETRLESEGFASRPLIMLSSGGVVGPRTAGHMPVRMIESGPAAGALGAAFAAKALGLADLLAFDMGGTTAKVCLIRDYRPLVTGVFEIDRMYRLKEGSGIPITVPCIDLIEIGAGGGSIAHVSELGLLNVGPRSAGSRPGPACYGRGGTDATVTDADVVLGVIDPRKFLGGAMPLDASAARHAVGKIGEALGVSPTAAARGIYQIVCEAMAGAVRAHATDRGVDYRGIPLLAFGGAGPVHACAVAELLNGSTVIFPPLASVYSAFGSLVTPTRLDLVRSGLSSLSDLDWEGVAALFDEMAREGRSALSEAGCPEERVAFRHGADMRYRGQHFEIIVELDHCPSGDTARLRRAFEDAYLKIYKLIQPDVEVEVVNWRMTAIGGASETPQLDMRGEAWEAAEECRLVHLWRDDERMRILQRASLATGCRVEGPVIIEEAETTLVIPADWSASLGPMGSVLAKRKPRR